MEKRRCKDKK